jgi:hypothetical protein
MAASIFRQRPRRAQPRLCKFFSWAPVSINIEKKGTIIHLVRIQFLRELPETLIDDLATKCRLDQPTITARSLLASGQQTSDY